jgi:hypothetical protein
MEQSDVRKTVVTYAASRCGRFANTMNYQSCFSIEAAVGEDGTRGDSERVQGDTVDVLAELVETKRLFGHGIPNCPTRALSPQNARVVRLDSQEGEPITTEKTIVRKHYLDQIRDRQGFREVAQEAGVPVDFLEPAMDKLFGK